MSKSDNSLEVSQQSRLMLEDHVWMKNGKCYSGLIIKKTPHEIILEHKHQEMSIPRKEILRFDDTSKSMLYFPELVDHDQLPAWRMMIQDFRSNDQVYAFYQIPPISITEGPLRDIAYLSFAINKRSFLNIFGDPNNPVAISLGTYEVGARRQYFRQLAREFIAGYLTTKDEITTLYELHDLNDSRYAGSFRFRLHTSNQRNVGGGCVFIIEKPEALSAARIAKKRYLKETLPFLKVRRKDGLVRYPPESPMIKKFHSAIKNSFGIKNFWKGFYKTGEKGLRIVS